MTRPRALLFVALVLYSGVILAQQMKGDISSIGLYTRADCEAKGGAWKVQGTETKEACYFSSIEACRRNGGIEDRYGQPPQVHCNFFLAEKWAREREAKLPANMGSHGLYSKSDCEAKGGVWRRREIDSEEKCYFRSVLDCVRNGGVEDRFRARHPKDIKCNFFLAEKRDKCLADGGTFQPMGLARSPGCIRYAKDAGKPCLGKGDCEAACLYVYAPGVRPQSGMEAVGQCAPNDNPFGCKSFVENGRVVIGPCRD
jgi:hypothetical protein